MYVINGVSYFTYYVQDLSWNMIILLPHRFKTFALCSLKVYRGQSKT